MTTRLEQAFAEASKLPPTEQDAVADWLLAELESERRWDKLFADSQDILSKLVAEALAEHRNGQVTNYGETKDERDAEDRLGPSGWTSCVPVHINK